MFVVKYRKINATKNAEDIHIRVMEAGGDYVGLVVEMPVSFPVTLQQTIVFLAPDPKETSPRPSTAWVFRPISMQWKCTQR